MKRRRVRAPSSAPSVMEMRAGPGPTIADGPRTWRLGWNDQDAKAQLESLVVARATDEALERMAAMTPEKARALFVLFQDHVDSGAYHTFASGWTNVMGGPDSSWLFLLSLLRRHHPDATAADAKRLIAEVPERVRVAVSVVTPDFFEAVVRQVGVEPTATAEQVRGAVEKLAAAVMEKFPTPAPATA